MTEGIHIGSDVNTDEPVYVPIHVFKQHSVIRGMTGSMKSVWLTYLLAQIISQTDSCIVFVDYGGDQFTFNVLKEIAESRGRRFKFLSTNHFDDWNNFEPMQSCTPLTDATLIRATNFLVTALSLSFGEGFQTGYFGDISTLTIQDTLSHCIASGILTPDIKTLAKVTEKTSKNYRRNDVAQAEMALRQLSNYPQLSIAKKNERAIQFDRAIEDGEIITAFLPGLMDPNAVKIGALLAWGAVLRAKDRVDAGLPKKDIYLVLEECSIIARSPSFAKLLTLGRKYGVRIIMLHQTSEQLKGGGQTPDMRPVVSDNTSIKLFLTSTNREDEEQLRGFSEDVEKTRDGGKSFNGLNASTQIRGVFEPRLERNDILHASAITGQGFLVIKAGDKHREPIRIKFDPIYFKDTFTPESHDRLSSIPLPMRGDSATGKGAVAPDSAARADAATALTPERQAWRDAVQAIVAECRAEERWDDLAI